MNFGDLRLTVFFTLSDFKNNTIMTQKILFKLGPFLNDKGISGSSHLVHNRHAARSYQADNIPPAPSATETDFSPLEGGINPKLKRAFDLVFSTIVLIILAPTVFVVIAAIIKLTSRGPVFFTQERTGFENKPFKMIKFRTMTVNDESGTVQCKKNDARITPIGAFLRKKSLDELPQFINVFLGHMSVVGPRPHMLAHTDYYAPLVDDYLDRHDVKPGVTGWAQISGFRGPTDELWKMEKRVEHDLWYINNYNFLLDIKCVLKTVVNAAGDEANAI